MKAKLINGKLVFPPKNHNGITNYYLNENKLIKDGWKEVIYSNGTDLTKTDEQEFYSYFEETDTQITQHWGVRDIDKNILINRYKKQLEDYDKEIPRALEDLIAFQMQTGYEPYPRQSEIISEKQSIRDKINALEADN